jgi:predicted house-cleaning NTP pyrophosphatase (Maf/HAM1 superfamily)
MLFSRPHKVITGVAVVCKSRQIEIVEADTTVVYPRPLTDSQIAEHIASCIWRDKAGAYAIQEHAPASDSAKATPDKSPKGYPASLRNYAEVNAVTSDPFVDHIEGSLTNVMGLPMEMLKKIYPVR